MRPELKKIIAAAQLFSLPEVYLRLRKLLNEPDYAMAEVAVIISYDAGVTARLLRLVNSSLYGFSNKIETVSRAITLLGTQQLHDLVLATSVSEAFSGLSSEVMDMSRFWRRSVYCAVAARHLAKVCKRGDPERLFVAGLLHDLGHLIIYQAIPELGAQALALAKTRKEPLYKIERELMGFDAASVSSELFVQWSLPESLREIVSCHVEPETAEKFPFETAIVHLGALLAHADDVAGLDVEDSRFNEGALSVEPAVWTVTGLTVDDCQVAAEQAESEVQEVMNLIFPGVGLG